MAAQMPAETPSQSLHPGPSLEVFRELTVQSADATSSPTHLGSVA